jgi:hypothetical protein
VLFVAVSTGLSEFKDHIVFPAVCKH